MEIVKIDAELRASVGKGPSVRLRREGKIPAIAYGNELPTVHLAISPKALLSLLKSEYGQNAVVELNVAQGRSITALVRDYSYHPVTRDLTHVDFVEVRLDREVDVEIPFHTFGKSVGITAGGVLRVVFRRLPIRCVPEKIPVRIDHDITNVGLNDVVKVAQLTLPAGVKVRLPDEQTVASVTSPEKDRSEDAATAPADGAAPAAAKDDKAAAKDTKKK